MEKRNKFKPLIGEEISGQSGTCVTQVKTKIDEAIKNKVEEQLESLFEEVKKLPKTDGTKEFEKLAKGSSDKIFQQVNGFVDSFLSKASAELNNDDRQACEDIIKLEYFSSRNAKTLIDKEIVNQIKNGGWQKKINDEIVNEDRETELSITREKPSGTVSANTDTKSPSAKNINAAPSNSPSEKVPVTATETSEQPPPEPNVLSALAGTAAILTAVLMAAILGKKLYDKWKYGRNALKNLRGLKRAVQAKNDLTEKWLKKRRSANIHAIGVGKLAGTDDFCIQVFVEDANGEMLEDPPTRLLPTAYQNLPIVIYEMPRADFLGLQLGANEDFPVERARVGHDVLRGGLSGANANLTGEAGTIGYFFRPNFIDNVLHAFLKKHVYLLSNSHVFVDLTRVDKDDSDLILHPSPGEPSASKAVAELYDYKPLVFGGDVENPNFVDAAIAKLHRGQTHRPEIPLIGRVTDFLRKEQVELRSACRKFGRTTGYTRGRVFSIHLSIWVKYSARGREAFFKDQFLIIPMDGGSFVKSGDSGALLVDDENRAVGLIFAGAGEKTALQFEDIGQALDLEKLTAAQTPRIEHYGVANAISDVMREFKIKLDDGL